MRGLLRQGRGPLILILVVALGLRVGLVATTGEHVPWGDPLDYDRHAAHLVEHGTYPPSNQAAPGSPAAFRPPAWPHLLAGVYEVTGERWTAGRLAAAVLGTLSVALVYAIAGAALGPAVGRAAGWVAAVFPPMVFLSGSLVAESLFVPLMLASAWATLRARDHEHRFRWAVMAGAACGLAALTRTNGLALLVPVAIGLAAASGCRPRRPAARAVLVPAVAMLAAALTIAPWTIRNAAAFGEFVPVSTQGGYTMAAVWNADADISGPDRGAPHYGPVEPYQHRPGVDEVELARTLRRQGRDYAEDHPGYVVELAGLNVLRMFKLAGDESFTFYWNLERDMTPWRRAVDSVGLAVVAALALLALVARRGRRGLARAPLWLWLFPALMFASSVLLLGNPRYRAPIDPFLALAAGVGVAEVLRRGPRPAAPGAGRASAAAERQRLLTER
jgi:4-amino-4-deoxy-L-arabinose transferase-like glycosyltransferase